MNVKKPLTLAALVVGIAVVAAVVKPHQWVSEQLAADETEIAVAEPETAEVSTRTLSIDISADGSLVYAGNVGAYAAIESPDGGVITNVVTEDSSAPAGTVLWRIGLDPTVLLTGALPSYRALESGDTGADVWQLEANLVALGFDPDETVTVDDTYTYNTSLMVERWQESVGADPTGSVAKGAVIYASADRRVGVVDVAIGDTVTDGQAMLELTGRDREAVFTVEASDRADVTMGDLAMIQLPDRSEVEATVATIVVDETGGASVTATLVEPTEQRADNLPITASWSVTIADDVVTVPENALLRLDSGAYVVELADGARVSVTPSAGADGWVEVDGELTPGDLVLAP